MDQATSGVNAARFNAARIRELDEQNKRLYRKVRRMSADGAAQMKRRQIELSTYKTAISDFNAAFMEWMPMLRHADSEVAQGVARAMREFKGEIEGRFNGRSS